MTSRVLDCDTKTVFWHRELPPLDAEPIGERMVEATSISVPGTLAHRDELWQRCYADLMKNVGRRIEQEVDRAGGDYAHVLNEFVDSRHNDVSNVAWLHGAFAYVLYRRTVQSTVT